MEGHGAFYYADSSRYVGDWKEDKKDGQGTFYYEDGSIFVGRFENDVRKEGIFVDANGVEHDLTADDN